MIVWWQRAAWARPRPGTMKSFAPPKVDISIKGGMDTMKNINGGSALTSASASWCPATYTVLFWSIKGGMKKMASGAKGMASAGKSGLASGLTGAPAVVPTGLTNAARGAVGGVTNKARGAVGGVANKARGAAQA